MAMKNLDCKKLISLTLAALIAVSSCSCSSKRKYNEIQADDPWYEYSSFDVSDLYPESEYEYAGYETIGVDKDSIFVQVEASKHYEHRKDMTEEELLQYFEMSILEFSFDGKLLNKTEYSSMSDDGRIRMLQKAWISEGKLNTLETLFSLKEYTGEYLINGEHFELGELAKRHGLTSIQDIYTESGNTLIIANGGDSNSMLVLIRPDGTEMILDAYETLKIGCNYSELIPANNGKVLIAAYTWNYEMVFLSLDLATTELKEVDSLYGFDMYWPEFINGKVIARDYEGLGYLDEITGKINRICKYTDIDAPITEILESPILYVSEDNSEIIMGLEIYETDYEGYRIIHLNKASTNPNAGKTELILSFGEDIYPLTFEYIAINNFNKTNPSYFIKTVFPYDENFNYKEVDADIILSTNPTSSPSDASKYIDLAEYINTGDEAFRKEYFANAMDAAKQGNALYYVPLDISCSGIMTSRTNAPKGQDGFSFDSYVEFVDKVCNGIDPMSKTPNFEMGKVEYFTALFKNMSDLYIYDGKAHFDNESFRELLEFVDKYGIDATEGSDTLSGGHNGAIQAVVVEIKDHNSAVTEAKIEGKIGAQYGYLYDFNAYIERYAYYAEEIGVYGLPSFDGRGPMAVSDNYVSVSSSTKYKEPCVEFVKLLLSYDVQKENAINPINRQALRNRCEKIIANTNSRIAQEATSTGTKPFVIPDDAIDNYIDVLSSANGVKSIGDSIENIIREEASSYYSGRKSLDDTISVMQKRVQIALDESK